MKFLRLILKLLALAIALAVFLAAIAFVPAVQTLLAQAAIANQPGLQGSLGSVSAGFGRVEVEDLQLQYGGAVLTVPSLQAGLPLTTAALDRKAVVRRLVAKGWTLDLSRMPEVAAAPVQVARFFGGILSRWALPCDVSFDGVDLEGDVLLPAPKGKEPASIHLIVKGGGMAAGREGAFEFTAEGTLTDAALYVSTIGAQGRLVVAMDSPRTVGRIRINAGLSAKGGPVPEDLALAADLGADRGKGGETYSVDLSRGGRHLATVLAGFPDATGRLSGTWKVDFQDADLAPFVPGRPLPSVAASGEGRFDSDAALARVHALGRLKAMASRLEVLAPSLGRLGAVALDARFDLAESGRSIRVDALDVAIAGERPVAELQALQPFEIDTRTGELKSRDPGADWMGAAIRGLPLAWISGPADRLAIAGDDATGEFTVRAADGGFTLRAKTPLVARAVTVQSGGRILGQGLDVSLQLLADRDAKGWQLRFAPLSIASAGRRLASVEGRASRTAGADQPIAIAGTWNADLEALATDPATPGFGWIAGRSVSGDFSGSVGGAAELEGKFAALGRDPGRSLNASVKADVYADGTVSFNGPIRIATGTDVSAVSAEGTWSPGESGARVEVKLTGENVSLEHLGLLAAPLAAAGHGSLPASLPGRGGGPRSLAGAKDRTPFWGQGTGQVTFAFDRVRAAGHVFSDVGGTFDVDGHSVELSGGRAKLPHHGLAKANGSVSFDAASDFPYSLKASAVADEVDAAPFFAKQKPGTDPLFQGRFSVTGTLAGSGINLGDLVGRAQEEFRLTSAGGVVRILKTSVAESIPEVSSPVKDTLGTVGSAFGSLLGVRRSAMDMGKNPLSKNAEAVLDLTDRLSEFDYDQITVTGIRESDGSIRLTEIAMTAPDERLTGSGRIACVEGLPLQARPLSMELRFGAHGKIAELLSAAGLLSSQKDNVGFTMLTQPIHFGGTLENLDGTEWHDLLVKAATQKPGATPRPGP